MSRVTAIEYRLAGRLTGPTGEADFAREAADDLEWCIERMHEVARAVAAAEDENVDWPEAAIDRLPELLKDAAEHRSMIDELEKERDELKESLEEKSDDLRAAEKALKEADARLEELEAEAAE